MLWCETHWPFTFNSFRQLLLGVLGIISLFVFVVRRACASTELERLTFFEFIFQQRNMNKKKSASSFAFFLWIWMIFGCCWFFWLFVCLLSFVRYLLGDRDQNSSHSSHTATSWTRITLILYPYSVVDIIKIQEGVEPHSGISNLLLYFYIFYPALDSWQSEIFIHNPHTCSSVPEFFGLGELTSLCFCCVTWLTTWQRMKCVSDNFAHTDTMCQSSTRKIACLNKTTVILMPMTVIL